MLKIDMHTHILPEQWPDLNQECNVCGFPTLERRDGRYQIMRDGKFFREVGQNTFDIPLRIEQFLEVGIQVQVVSTVPVMFSYWAEPEYTLRFARFLNDHAARAQADYPKNIIALGTLPLQDADLSIQELRRLKEELDIPGIQIGSHVNGKNLDDPEIFAVFEAAQDLDMAIIVHPWEMMGSDSMPKYWLPWLVGMPAELTRAICCLIFGGVMERLPRLRFCFAHGGGSFPYTIGRIEHGFNMRPDLVATDNPVNPRNYLRRFYVDSITHDPQALRYLLDVMGNKRVMLGSDYPFPLGEQSPGSGIDTLDLPPPDQARLFHQNTLDWLGLDKERFL